MAGRWDDKDANGKLLTDGRKCYVITSDTNPEMPPIRIYGKDEQEILDKAARTIETGQGEIQRLRKGSTTPAPVNAPQVDLVTAVADLSNPQKAGNAVKNLLKSVGVDVDQQQMERAVRSVANIALAWELGHPDYPKDPRNDRILMQMAANKAGGFHRVTATHLDAAFVEAQQHELFFEPKPTVQPDGNPDSRTGTEATTYRRNSLRSAQPVVRDENAKHARWRKILNEGTGKALEEAMKTEPGFSEWVEKEATRTAA